MACSVGPPELKAAFDGVDRAQAQIQQAAEHHAAALKAYQPDATGHFLRQNLEAAVKQTFENSSSASNTKTILNKLGRDPDAAAGLRRAVGDYIGDQYSPLSQTSSTIADAAKAKSV